MVASWLSGSFLTCLIFLIYRNPREFGAHGQFQEKPTLIANADTSNIFVLEFQIGGYASEASTATYNGTIEEPLASFSMCFRIQIHYERPRMYVFTYGVSDVNANEMFAEFHLGRRAFRACKKGTKFCGWHREMPAFYTWRHLCLSYDAGKDQFKMFADGEKVESGSWSDNPHLVGSGGITILGQDQDNLGGGFDRRQSFSGFVSQFNVWNFALDDWQIENMAECRADNWGNVMASKEENFIIGEEMVNVKTMPLFQLCESGETEESKYFFFNDQWSYGFYKSWCYNMGGGIALPENQEHFHSQMDIAEGLVKGDIHEKCIHSSGNLLYWIGFTDEFEEGVWANPYTKEPMGYEGFWEAGQPNGERAENCARTYIDRKWQDKDCGERNCALCFFPDGMNLTMRGLCKSETTLMEGFFDTAYFVYGFAAGRPEWRGMGKSHIYFLPTSLEWKIQSFYDTTKFATFEADDTRSYTFYPTGRTTWRINSGICRLKNEPRRLSLTNCVLEDGKTDFTCRDGTCIDINKLCDLSVDCPDRSDEKDCELLILPDDYRGEKFPIQNSREPIGLYMNISVLAFPDVDTLESNYLVDFDISMRWIDPRLKFLNLKDLWYLNSLPMDTMRKMWIPVMSFPNALQAEGTQVDEGATLFVIKLGKRMADDLSIARENKVYRGEECPLVIKKEYFILFSCDFHLAMYPFDSNICTMEFEVSGVNKDYVYLLIDDVWGGKGIEYTGKRDLLEYSVGDVMMENLSNGTEFYGLAQAKIVFQRKWIYHLITIFLQSILLLAVAYLTFYFRLNNFQDRIMISITCMLIISTIQSSIDKMVPKTSYLKMVDIFLIYSFNIVIVIMAIHTFMDMQIHRDDVTGRVVDKPSRPPSHVTKVHPMTDSESEPVSTISSRINSAKSLVGSMFSGSEDEEFENNEDAYARARKMNHYGSMSLLGSFILFNIIFWSVSLNHYFTPVVFKSDHEFKNELMDNPLENL